jgi:hypothetical protein
MKSDHSFRIQRNIQKAMALGLLTQQPPLDESVTWRDIPALRKAAADPYAILDKLIGKSALSADAIEALRAIGAGSSPWIQLANYLMRQECE